MRWLDQVLFALACLAAAAILVLQLGEIIARLLGSSLPFVSETTGFLMAALTFLALPVVTRRNEHLTADFVLLMMPDRMRRGVEGLLSPLAFVVYAGALIVLLYGLAAASFLDEVRSEGITRTPLWIPQALLILGLLATFVRLSAMLWAFVRNASAADRE